MDMLNYIKGIKRVPACCVLLFGILCGIQAQEGTAEDISGKPVLLYFRFDKSLVDSGYHDNRHTLRVLHELFSDSAITCRIEGVSVRAYSSPEGNVTYNHNLARRRARAVKGYLVWKYPHLNQYSIHTDACVSEWEGLLPFIGSFPDIPCRSQIMDILSSDISNEVKETRLKAVGGGSAYWYIRRKILPELRNASVCTVFIRPMKHPESSHPVAFQADVFDTNIIPNGASSGHAGRSGGVSSPSYEKGGKGRDASVTPCKTGGAYVTGISGMIGSSQSIAPVFTGKVPKRPFIALKTNLLFDLSLMPNIEVEVPFGNRWSLNGELMFPWWLMDGDKYCLQILMGGVEGRYWLGSRKNRDNRKVLTGHFLGLYAGGGKYDLQWDRNGYQGEFFIAAGISYGYSTPIARNLNLEFSLGIGLLRTGYEHYHARDNYQTLLWQNNGRYTWIGPTKAKVSLVWMLNLKMKKGGER